MGHLNCATSWLAGRQIRAKLSNLQLPPTQSSSCQPETPRLRGPTLGQRRQGNLANFGAHIVPFGRERGGAVCLLISTYDAGPTSLFASAIQFARRSFVEGSLGSAPTWSWSLSSANALPNLRMVYSETEPTRD